MNSAWNEPPDIAEELAPIEAEAVPGEGAPIQAFPIVRADELEGIAEAMDFVEGLLTEGGASVVYGPSNCGKSFWILDLAAAIATGRPFRDELEVERGAVVYVALEGSHGARNRIEALRREGRLPDDAPLFLCFAPVSLLDVTHPAKLAESIEQAAAASNLPCRLVVLDTLARAMAGGDENGARDMTVAVASMDAIRAATGAHVALVHHCGKDEARGARGHSSLRAAVDTEIEVTRNDGENVSTVRVTKQRDLPPGEAMPFSLRVVELATDRRGRAITSCVVHHEPLCMAAVKSQPGRKKENRPEELLEYLPADSTAAWQKRAESESGVSKSTFYRLLPVLKQSKAISQNENGGWDTRKPLPF